MRCAPWIRRTLALPVGALASLALAGCAGDEVLEPVPIEAAGPGPGGGPQVPLTEEGAILVHYYRPLEDYAGWTLNASGDLPERLSGAAAVAQGEPDGFGATFTVPTTKDAESVRITIENGGTLAPDGEVEVRVAELGNEVWVYSDSPRAFSAAPAIPTDDTAVLYYRRADGLYGGWGAHLWGDTTDTPSWGEPVQAAGEDAFGAFYVVHLTPGAQQVNFILHQGDTKDPGPDQALSLGEQGRRVWVLSGDTTLYTYPADPPLIDARRAHWIDARTIAWDLSGDDRTLASTTFALHWAADGSVRAEGGEIVGGDAIPLAFDPTGLPATAKDRFPHLGGYRALRLSDADLGKAPEILKGQIVVSARLPNGSVVATGAQIPGVLDDLYAYDGALGVELGAGAPALRVWAPTARSVALHLFDDASPDTQATIVPMSEQDGVWSAAGDSSWNGKFYLYDVEVFAPSTGRVEHNLVTDPYAISLSTNSQRSQIVDLSAAALKPPGWDALAKPAFSAPQRAAIYELHVRDFSVSDASVPAALRGTFLAFTQASSNGMAHLTDLAQAGLTHVHLLPSFDFATVNEERAEQKEPGNLSVYAADSDKQQAAITAVRSEDAFNWGYDPWHYTVPEGSYATDPDGPARVLEFRAMVKALNDAGLRVVMDVVYNHTTASGQHPKSVLDRIVPGYYHRLDDKGAVATSTCCQNTATEHVMMEKLMVDSLLTWAKAYKVDGFRFDLMGHHMKANLLKVKGALGALTPAQDGVDGASLLLYGEGWDFGEVAGNARGENATQRNMAGTGIGTFNDRLRDAVRGGGPFDSGDSLRRQGFSNGLFTDPNDADQGTPDDQQARLFLYMDQIRVGLAGNLRDYAFVDRTGAVVTGAGVDYNGAPAGYTLDPGEAITYVEAHDNQTLWDILQYKIPTGTAAAARVRMHTLAVSVTALGLGVPFFHAGMDMLRSKSLDRDSYDSGDWFNRLDFTYATNHFGVGLPPADANASSWPLMGPLLTDPDIQVGQAQILAATAHLREMLAIRRSTPLFRLETGAEVMARVRFHNTGPDQLPGVIVMSVSDEVSGLPDLDPQTEAVVVVLNARPDDVTLALPGFAGAQLALHPLQQASADPVVQTAAFAAGEVSVPARTTAVYFGSGLP